MKSSLKLIAAMTVGAVASAASLQAITINFAFTDSGANVPSLTKTHVGSGVQVTVTGVTTTNGNSWFYRDISRNGSLGLGVDGANDGHAIDNDDSDDFLLFQFSQPVDVNSFTMGYVNGDSDFRWAVGSPGGSLDNILDTLWSAGLNVNGGSTAPVTHSINPLDLVHTYLLIGASSSGSNDQFKISGVSVNYNPPTTNVPDAGSSAILLGVAVAGLGFFARRRAAK